MVMSRALVTRRSTVLAILVMFGSLLMALSVWSATAQAGLTHLYTGQSFGPSGLGAGEFAGVHSVAVDQSSGDVFVYDSGGGGRVYKFDATGEPVDFSASATNVIEGVGNAGNAETEIAVDDSSGPDAGDIYVANNSVVRIYGASGSFLGELTGGETCGVAVDPSGAVYVGVYPSTVRKYTPVSNPVTNADESAAMGGLESVCNVAADSAGNVYAAKYYPGGVTRYDALQFGSPAATGTLIDAYGRTLAVDPSTDELYANGVSSINQYDSSGGFLGNSGSSQLGNSFGVAVSSGGDIYAPAVGNRIDIFGPAVVVPDVLTQAPSSIADTTATVAGTVNPDGIATTYQFQYGTSAAYGSFSPASPASVGSDSSVHELSAELGGLAPSTVYHYRIIATNANGTSVGADESFRTTGPPTVDGQFVTALAQKAATIEALINPGGFDTSYQVEYGTSESYGSATAPADIGSANVDQSVSVELGSLQVGTTYHFRVVAINSQGPPVAGPDQTFTTLPFLRIDEQSFSDVGSSNATLKAQVNDFGLLSTYHYEYGTSSSYGSVTPETSLGSTNGDVGAPALLSALAPSTTYHFRIVVTNEAGTLQGADVQFTTLPLSSGALPDGRIYEMVTPPDNQNANVYAPISDSYPVDYSTVHTSRRFQASLDGNAVAYIAAPTSGGNGSYLGGNQYVAVRSASGWRQTVVQPQGLGGAAYQGFSSDVSVGFLDTCPEPLSAAAPVGYHMLYSHPLSGDTYVPFLTSAPPNRTPLEFGAAGPSASTAGCPPAMTYAGSSSDSSHILFEANDALTPDAALHPPSAEENDLYDSIDGHLNSVNVLPGASGAVTPNATFGSYWPQLHELDLSHVISSDGSRIFWTDLNTGNLYVREDIGTPAAKTVQVDTSAGGGGSFWTASSTGSRVFFTKAGDLYAFDTGSEQTSDLAPGGEVQGVVDASEDGSYVYYVANAQLASGATAGQPNLYVQRDSGSGWGSPVFIATLSPADNSGGNGQPGDWLPGLDDRSAESTPNGQKLVFVSVARLSAYDNRGQIEVYVYDAATSELICASCNPSGEPSLEQSTVHLPISLNKNHIMRWISADGDRVFFTTPGPLVAEDTNAHLDVYEWERNGTGGCHLPNGCISLLSSGTSPANSYFVDASLDGSDVFIVTRSQLTPADRNENYDLYDVHAGGIVPPSPPACSGSGCQGAPPAPPIFATPSSVTFNGVGNFPPGVNAARKPKSRELTRAQLLTKALKACVKKPQRKRAACRAQAKKRYGVKSKSKSSKSRKGSKHHA